ISEDNEQKELAEKIQLGKVIVEEFAKLVKRRAGMTVSSGDEKKDEKMMRMHSDADFHQIEEIQNKILPAIEAGDFDLIVRGSTITVETEDRSTVFPNAPDSHWDEEFEQNVRNAVAGNEYAKGIFSQVEENRRQFEARNKIGQTLR
ncbi:hypothetical protein KKF04_04200, partial [Patescibacteria group bacterium]|nr:hypothetical protein [Patescibacteria group bacterium]